MEDLNWSEETPHNAVVESLTQNMVVNKIEQSRSHKANSKYMDDNDAFEWENVS